MALSEETGIIAISSGSKQGNLYFVKDAFTTPYLIPNCRFRVSKHLYHAVLTQYSQKKKKKKKK
jgi:hypothetical protein